MQPLIELQIEMRAAIGKPKDEVELFEMNSDLETAVKAKMGNKVRGAATLTNREQRNSAMDAIREVVMGEFEEEDDETDLGAVREVIGDQLKKEIRNRILHDGIRPDGRKYDEIRELGSEVGLTPRTHGSGFFKRGETHCLSIVTLGTPREAMKLDGLYPEDSRRFMLHYNFPPYSTGETWFLRGPKRREIGHGMLGRTALKYVIPSEEEFPYTIRIVSEIMSSNGSTSQASICAGTLALMDCGVPIKAPVAGIAMGMISDGNKYAILSDIQGMEDHLGDMDFKVAGTKDGVTALQMDIKIAGISPEMMGEALEQARRGRLEILDSMLATIAEPRAEMNQNAPRMETISIPSSKIGAVIGKGGATIRMLEETYEVSIDIQEDGTIFVAGVDGAKTAGALEYINTLTQGVEPGAIYDGKVVRIEPFGAFVELLPGVDGLVHISQISTERIESVESAVQLGDQIKVMVTDVDPNTDKVRLSRKAILEGWTLEEAREADSGGKKGGGNRGGGRDNRGGGNRGGGNRGGGNRGGGNRRRD
jgi:polyribonucleotide nucleotidyltransferase